MIGDLRPPYLPEPESATNPARGRLYFADRDGLIVGLTDYREFAERVVELERIAAELTKLDPEDLDIDVCTWAVEELKKLETGESRETQTRRPQ